MDVHPDQTYSLKTPLYLDQIMQDSLKYGDVVNADGAVGRDLSIILQHKMTGVFNAVPLISQIFNKIPIKHQLMNLLPICS
ncbi:MAG: hypothetical protein D6737_00220 [Chloroflexi bacterium]|nr:MAG: hypothetical protein D6737_00220 [Chloroflexota bacterium]